MIGTYIDLPLDEVNLFILRRRLFTKDVCFQSNEYKLKGYVSVGNNCIAIWYQKKASKHEDAGSVILIIKLNTWKVLKKYELRCNVLKITPRVKRNELVLYTTSGIYTYCYLNGAYQPVISEAPEACSLFAAPEGRSMFILKKEPTISIVEHFMANNEEKVLIDFGFRGEITNQILEIEEMNLIAFIVNVEGQNNNVRANLRRADSKIVFIVFNLETKTISSKVNKSVPGILVQKLHRYDPLQKTLVIEYSRLSEKGSYLSQWRIEEQGLVELNSIKIDYYAGLGPRTLFLAAMPQFEKFFLLVETTKQRELQENLGCVCSSANLVTIDINSLRIEAYYPVMNQNIKDRLRHIKFYDKETDAFFSCHEGSFSIIDGRTLCKEKFADPPTLSEFDEWVKETRLPAKIQTVFYLNDPGY